MTDLFFHPREDFVREEDRLYLGGIKLAEALQLWREESCSEFTGGKHSYMMHVEEGRARVYCEVCRANPLEDGDLNEFLYFGPIPVNLRIQNIVYPGGPWGPTEYDVEVEVTTR